MRSSIRRSTPFIGEACHSSVSESMTTRTVKSAFSSISIPFPNSGSCSHGPRQTGVTTFRGQSRACISGPVHCKRRQLIRALQQVRPRAEPRAAENLAMAGNWAMDPRPPNRFLSRSRRSLSVFLCDFDIRTWQASHFSGPNSATMALQLLVKIPTIKPQTTEKRPLLGHIF